MCWNPKKGIDGEIVSSIVRSKERIDPDRRYLQVCVKIHNFYKHLEEIQVEKTRDAREKEGIRRSIRELRKTFREELRFALERMR